MALNLVDLMPDDTPSFMVGAWLSALHYAIGDAEALATFRALTGNKWTPGKSGLEQMIDDASGAQEAFVREFVEWFNANIWGPMEDETYEQN